MSPHEPEPESAGPAVSRRELAVARSLDPARVRAEKRVQRFLDAALELMRAAPDRDFTVQDVVERSGQSLRSFYQYFAGKHELLLALFEESVRTTAEHLRARAGSVGDPLERLHGLVLEYHRLCQHTGPGRAAGPASPVLMAEFAQQLLTTHPAEAARAFVPLVALVDEVLSEARAAGAIRADVPGRGVAGIVLQAVMFNAFAAIISGAPAPRERAAAEQLWLVLLAGIGAPGRSGAAGAPSSTS